MAYTDPKSGGYSDGDPLPATHLNAFRDAHDTALYGDTQMSAGEYVAYSFASYANTANFSVTTAIARLTGAISGTVNVTLPSSSVPTGARLSITCIGNGQSPSMYSIGTALGTAVELDGDVVGAAELYWNGSTWACSVVSGGAGNPTY